MTKPVDALDRDARRAHFRGQAAERLVDAVLHVDRRDILVARDVERHGDRADAAVGARRGHVEHALDAVDRLLERRGDRRLDLLRVRAGVERRDGDLRRRQRRGYCAIGIDGIAIAPARMMTSEQTEARIGSAADEVST